MKCATCGGSLPPELEQQYAKTLTLKNEPFCSVDCYFKGRLALKNLDVGETIKEGPE